jgi:hypothetical protein
MNCCSSSCLLWEHMELIHFSRRGRLLLLLQTAKRSPLPHAGSPVFCSYRILGRLHRVCVGSAHAQYGLHRLQHVPNVAPISETASPSRPGAGSEGHLVCSARRRTAEWSLGIVTGRSAGHGRHYSEGSTRPASRGGMEIGLLQVFTRGLFCHSHPPMSGRFLLRSKEVTNDRK